LYWHSHDTFEVDTLTIDIDESAAVEELKYRTSSRLRHKGTFIAPDEDGNWIYHQTDSKHDWSRSIRKTRWLFEIARATRFVADRESRPVAVMWFIGNHPNASKHEVSQ